MRETPDGTTDVADPSGTADPRGTADPAGTADPSGPATGVRLRAGTRARSLDQRGVAISAGASAVIVDGAGAHALWTAIEPVLRAGIEPERLLAAVPEHGRDVVSGILAQLEANHLLREVEPAADGVAAFAHLEQVSRRPVAATRLVAATTVRVSGDGPVARAAAVHLRTAGYADVVERTLTAEVPAVPGRPGVLGVLGVPETAVLARVERRGSDGDWHPVAFAVGDLRTVLVGPRNRDADAALELAALTRLAHPTAPDATAVHGAPAAPGPLLGVLVGAQLALATLASTARAADGTVPALRPEYLVTTGGLVSEPHPQVTLPRLTDRGRSLDVDAWRSGAPHDENGDPAALDLLEPVWDPVLGVVGQPLPLDLPQLPVGLAALVDDDGRTLGGVGTTTAAARLDVVLGALRVTAGGPPGALTGSLGLGASPAAARADAVCRLVDGSDLPWSRTPLDTARLGADVRRLHAAVTLQLARPVSVTLAVLGRGLHRADVTAADGGLLGRAVAAGAGAAVHGALLRTVGLTQWEHSGAQLVAPDPEVDVLETRTSSVRSEVDAWARTAVSAGTLRLVEPDGAEGWASVGLHAAVASWT